MPYPEAIAAVESPDAEPRTEGNAPAPASLQQAPASEDGSLPVGHALKNPANPFELFSFLWTRPPRPSPTLALSGGFILLPDPAALPLYVELAKLSGGPDAGDKMRQAAATFMGTEAYVRGLDALGAPADRFPVLLTRVGALQGQVIPSTLVKLSEEVIGEALGPYVASEGFALVKARTWQSLFAFSLIAPYEPVLGRTLVSVLRACRLLERIQNQDEALREQKGRDEALAALPALPDVVAPGAPRELPLPGTEREEAGWVRILGIGDLKSVQQRLLRYEPGEVAAVVNVMAFERQQWTERALSQDSETSESTARRLEAEDQVADDSHHTDLQRELRDVVAAESECQDYNGLKVEYGPTGREYTVNGTVSGTDCLQERNEQLAARFAADLTRRAAKRVTRAVTERQARRRYEERERVRQRTFDNATRPEHLVGVYRWLRKVYELHLEGKGKRLVLEFVVPAPAAQYVAQVEQRDVEPLTRPPPLDEQVQNAEGVTPGNYLRLAALYGVKDLPPPPVEQRVLTATLQQGAEVQATELVVPEGYTVHSGQVTYLLSDERSSLVGSVGGVTFRVPATAAEATIAPEREGAPGGCKPCAEPFPAQPAIPAQGTLPLPGLPTQERRFSAAVLSNARSFFVGVELTCVLEAKAERLAAWQLQVYQTLRDGYFERLHTWERTRALRLREDSAHRERAIEQTALEHSALDVLWACHVSSPRQAGEDPERPAYLRLLTRAFNWNEMAYTYFPWGPGANPGRATRHWSDEALLDDEDQARFQRFLRAGSARMLIPVRPGFELVVLFYLFFGRLWPADVSTTPVTASAIPLLTELLTRDVNPPPPAPSWRVELPTTLVVLHPGGVPTGKASQLLTPSEASQ